MQERLLFLDTALITPRTVVRRVRESDGKPLYDLVQTNWSWMNDFQRAPFLALESAQKSEVYCQVKLSKWLLQEEYNFGIWEKENAQLVGWITIYNIDWSLPGAHIRFLIKKELVDTGILREAIKEILAFSYQELELEKLYFTTLMDDYDGQRLVRQFNFSRQGDLRGAFRIQTGEIIDLILFGKTKLEYLKV